MDVKFQPDHGMQYFGYLLVLVHLFLLIWSLGGIIEFLSPTVPWTRYTNLDFPNWLLPIHWGLAFITGLGFLIGYFTAWSRTPEFMLAAYAMLLVLCIVETFGYMTSSTKYFALVSEAVAYTVILLILFKHKYFVEFFS